jgi:hypothetical protein
MTSEMLQEILDDWESWKYDIYESNKSTWTQRDDSKVDVITDILKEQLAWQKAADKR